MARIICLFRLFDRVTLMCTLQPHEKIAAALKVFNLENEVEWVS